jgi:PAS domain S-box-containing protein
MGTFPRHSGLFVFAAIATTAVVLLGFMGWPQPGRALEFSGLIVAAILTSVLAVQRPVAEDRGMMPLAFVIHFASLLLFGPLVTMIVVTAGTAAYMLGDPLWTRPPERSLMNAATTIAALHVAGVVHVVLGGTHGHFVWPWQGVPIALAAATYALAHTALAEIVVPLVTGQPINRSWPGTVLRDCPHHVIGAGLAVGLLEIIDHGLWEVLPVVALPLFFAHRAYCAHVSQIEYEHRSQGAIESLDEGPRGDRRPRLDHALESRARAHGGLHALPGAGPPADRGAAGAEEQRPAANHRRCDRARESAVTAALWSAVHLRRADSAGDDSAGRWQHDAVVARRDRAEAREYAVKRSEERLALAAEGASDGLWEWDLRTQEFYVSARWRAMVGLPATEAIGRIEDWTDRVHLDEIGSLKEALNAHLSGKTDHFQYEHRIRHESGTYRLFCAAGSPCVATPSAPFASPAR